MGAEITPVRLTVTLRLAHLFGSHPLVLTCLPSKKAEKACGFGLPRACVFETTEFMSATAPTPLTFFSLKEGLVESSARQDLVDAFAADFQGLRHFGVKIGEALDLGDAWTGIAQEDDLTVAYAYFGEGTGPNDPGAGALIGKKTLLYELLTKVTTQEL